MIALLPRAHVWAERVLFFRTRLKLDIFRLNPPPFFLRRLQALLARKRGAWRILAR